MRLFTIALISLTVLSLHAQEVFDVRPLDIRPLSENYSPVLQDSGFVMVSVREATGPIDHRDAMTGKPLSDLYWVPWKSAMTPGLPILFSANLATPVNEGPASFTDHGRTICFTRNTVLPRKLANLRAANSELGLFFSRFENGAWQAPIGFEHNSTKYSVVHPSFSADGLTLYFASNMPGGHGGMDLYRSRRSDDGWATPENLGPRVNSPGHEVFPCVQIDGTLYFSSDRVGGLGGLDIYATTLSGSEWGSPRQLPEPLNSTHNEHGYQAFPGGLEALFSSDRSGTDAILHAKRTVPRFRECAEQRRNDHCYAFRARAHSAMMNLPLDHMWDLGDGTLVKGLGAKHCYNSPGEYTVRSMLVDRRTGDVFHVLRSTELPTFDRVQAFISAPDTVRTGRPLILDPMASHVPGMIVAEYHWDLGDGTHATGRQVKHMYRESGTYDIRLDLISAPMDNGSIRNQCNTRSIVVVDRFREQENPTLAAVYQNVSMNDHEFQVLPYDEHYMNEDGHADARFSVELFASRDRLDLNDPRFSSVREMYRVVERYDPRRDMYTYSVGETNDLEELYSVFLRMKEFDFLSAEVFMLDMDKLIDMSELDMAALEDLNNSTIRSHAIHFAFNSADLEDGSLHVLRRLKDLLDQYPTLLLAVEAHTDDVGSTSYNMELSQQRAHSVTDQLIILGVPSERLKPIGHGKNHPLADNRTEVGRGMNRRVEFRMTLDNVQQAFEKTR